MIENILRTKKIKVTKSRILILTYIYFEKQVTIKDIIAKFKHINPSTIYRMLIMFESEGIIIKVVSNKKIYYKINTNDHRHFIECVNCHQKLELKECPYNNIDLQGFVIDKSENIKGICKKCQNEKIGIFVGSFNPPTKAHYEIAKKMLEENIVEKLVFIPCDNAKKTNLINIKYRYNMLIKMLEESSSMFVDNLKIEADIKTFNYNDLDKLKSKYGNNLYIIIGSDNLNDLEKWDNAEYMISNYHFIVINRNNNDDIGVIESKYKKYKNNFKIINYDNTISSTVVRNKIKNKDNLDSFLNESVVEYIEKNSLYQ